MHGKRTAIMGMLVLIGSLGAAGCGTPSGGASAPSNQSQAASRPPAAPQHSLTANRSAGHGAKIGAKQTANGVGENRTGGGTPQTSLQNQHIVSEPLPKGVKTVSDLWGWLLDQNLAEMNNPGQGEDCLDSACKIAATLYSGPSRQPPAQILDMVAYQPNANWHVIMAPVPQSGGDALARAQAFYKSTKSYPRPSGVCVVRTGEIDWYWIEEGRLYVMHQPRVT